MKLPSDPNRDPNDSDDPSNPAPPPHTAKPLHTSLSFSHPERSRGICCPGWGGSESSHRSLPNFIFMRRC